MAIFTVVARGTNARVRPVYLCDGRLNPVSCSPWRGDCVRAQCRRRL